MKPLFTVHAGEFLAGEYIERTLHLNVWVPAKDTGVDLLISDAKNKKVVSLQVKSSRDYFTRRDDKEWDKSLRAFGWWSLNGQKIRRASADYWVFVLIGFERRSTDFLIIKPGELLERLK